MSDKTNFLKSKISLTSFIIIAFGLIFTIIGIVICVNRYHKLSTFIPTTGTVIAYKYDTSSDDETLAAPIIEFYVNEVKYESCSDVYESHPPAIGKTVKICYNPNNPNEIILPNESKLLIIFPTVGGIVLLAGVGILIKDIVQSKRKVQVDNSNLSDNTL